MVSCRKVCCGLFCYRMEMHIMWKLGLHDETYRSAFMRFEYCASCPENIVKQIKFSFFAFFCGICSEVFVRMDRQIARYTHKCFVSLAGKVVKHGVRKRLEFAQINE